MTRAVDPVQNCSSRLSVVAAARQFGVPYSNLNSRIRGRQPKALRAELSRLTFRQEKLLAEWARIQAELGVPPSREDIYGLAERVLHRSGQAKRLGRQWLYHWPRRFPAVEVADSAELRESSRARNRRGPDENAPT